MKIKNLVDKTTSFLFKRLAEVTGLALLVLSVLLLISLISYSPEDPNFIFPENAEINNLLGKSLNVEIVELEKYDSEAIKTLFMNGYLFRVSEKLIISKNQRSDLIKIIEKLPQDFSVREFKEVSNLSRKYTIPFLEFLDRQLITKKINSEGLRRRID